MNSDLRNYNMYRAEVSQFQVKGVGKTFDDLGESVFAEFARLDMRKVDRTPGSSKVDSVQSVYVSAPGSTRGSREDVPVFELDSLEVGDVVEGPALIIDETQTVFVNTSVPGKDCFWRDR